MLYEIKALKAPWPKGAKVGDVVDMPFLPAWAVGKCGVALDGAVATVEFGAAPPTEAQQHAAELNGLRQRASELIDTHRAEFEQKVEALRAELQAAAANLEAAQSARAGAESAAAELRAQLDSTTSALDAANAKLSIPAVQSILAAEAQAAEERASVSAPSQAPPTKSKHKT